jgi:N-acetylglucosamine-6-phosphate deacetylase
VQGDAARPACAVLRSLGGDEFLSHGWIDIQINGLAGVDFGDPTITAQQFLGVARRLWSEGVTHFLPTLITGPLDRMGAALARLTEFAELPEIAPSVLGFHLEGPWLSPEDGPRGAHPKDCCRNPDWDDFRRLQDSARGMVKMVTLAPELPGAVSVIEKLTASGVKVAIGHTAADRSAILAAIDAGASLATHLGNAAHEMLHRHRNYVYDLLGDDRVSASLIVDGHHLPPWVVKSFVRAKGLERTILVSDAVALAGMPVGVYDAGYRKFEVRADGYIGVFGEPRMAGSGLILRKGVENLARFAGVNLEESLMTVTCNPAKWLGLEDRLGSLTSKEASTVRFRWDESKKQITVLETTLAGRQVFHRESMTEIFLSEH